MYLIGCLIRVPHLLCVDLCPIQAMKIKKTAANVPIGFEHYENEFEFTCDIEDPPCSFDADVPANSKYPNRSMAMAIPPAKIGSIGETADEDDGGILCNNKIEIVAGGRSKCI